MSKILIIDDERSIRNTLKDILEFEKHEVTLAEDGLVGLENLGEECWGGFAEEADEADEMLEVLLNKEEANEVEEAREVNEVEEVEERIEEDMVWSW